MSHLWIPFAQRWQLTPLQLQKFQMYYELLRTAPFNVTALDSLEDYITYHFDDALMASKAVDLTSVQTIADIGSGNGIPGIPLTIKYPHITAVLIEVQEKKRAFLEYVGTHLSLNVHVSALDWRTFLRKMNDPIELFCARASVDPHELIRMFKPSSPYKNSDLLYWASHKWQSDKTSKPYIIDVFSYMLNAKKRKLIHFKKAD